MNSKVVLKLARQIRRVVALWYEKAEQKNKLLSSVRRYCDSHSDPDLLHILLSNLIDNAIKYGELGSAITIKPTQAGLVIANQVSEQTQFDIDRVGERFYRGGI